MAKHQQDQIEDQNPKVIQIKLYIKKRNLQNLN